MTIEQKISYLNLTTAIYNLSPINENDVLNLISIDKNNEYENDFYYTIIFRNIEFNKNKTEQEIIDYLNDTLNTLKNIIDYNLTEKEKELIIQYSIIRQSMLSPGTLDFDNNIINFLNDNFEKENSCVWYFWNVIFYRWLGFKSFFNNKEEIQLFNNFVIKQQQYLAQYRTYTSIIKNFMIIDNN